MSLRLPHPAIGYDMQLMHRHNLAIERADSENRKTNQDVDIGGQAETKLLLYSPNGSQWNIQVDNAGVPQPTLVPGGTQWYEAGVSWTPALSFGGGSTGITYASRSGRYTRHGSMVFSAFSFLLTSKGVSTGDAVIGGLPYPANLENEGAVNISLYFNVSGLQVFSGFVNLGPAAASIVLTNNGGSGSSTVLDTNFTNTTQLFGTAIYRTP
jgi:hypothetical protein